MHPGLLNPIPKFIEVVPLGLMVKTPVTMGLSLSPGEDAIALIVVVVADRNRVRKTRSSCASDSFRP